MVLPSHPVPLLQRRRLLKASLAHKYIHRKEQQAAHAARRPGHDATVRVDVTDDVLLTARDDAEEEEEEEAGDQEVPTGPKRKRRRRH